MKEQKSNEKFIIIIAILSIIVVCMGAFILYDKILKPTNNEIVSPEKNHSETTKTENKNEKEDEKDSTTNNEETKNSDEKVESTNCTGKYYGETSGTLNNGLSYNYKYTYILNTDGTYTANFSDVEKVSGTYTINNGTISFIRPMNTGGGTYTENHRIAEDCSYITISDTTTTFNLNKLSN